MIEGLSPVAAGALASLAAGGATGLGALPILGVGPALMICLDVALS